jgi:hypothetical protein
MYGMGFLCIGGLFFIAAKTRKREIPPKLYTDYEH